MGMPPGAYRIEQRITTTEQLLREGFRPKEVAALIGYQDVFSFSKLFKHLRGITPARYRKDHLPHRDLDY